MARPQKEGLEYFNVNCDFNDAMQLIEAKHGLTGYAVVIKLWQKIYKTKGYYCEWQEKNKILFASNVLKISVETLNAIIEDCFDENIFSREKYNQYKVLTSAGIQKRYSKIVREARRTDCEIEKHLIVTEKEEKGVITEETAVIAEETHVITEEIPQKPELITAKSTQSKVKESKVKESKVNILSDVETKNLSPPKENYSSENYFKKTWDIFPNKTGRNLAFKSYKNSVKTKEDYENITTAINNYLQSKRVKDGYIQNGKTWYNNWKDWITPTDFMMKGFAKNETTKQNNQSSVIARATYEHSEADIHRYQELEETLTLNRELRKRSKPDTVETS